MTQCTRKFLEWPAVWIVVRFSKNKIQPKCIFRVAKGKHFYFRYIKWLGGGGGGTERNIFAPK